MTPDFSETNTQKEWREILKSLREREEKKSNWEFCSEQNDPSKVKKK